MPTYQIDGATFQSDSELTAAELDHLTGGSGQAEAPQTNAIQEFNNELARGAITSTQSSVNAVSGAVKALHNMTGLDLDQGGAIEKINTSLNTQLQQLPQSDNPFISIPANIIGGAPMAVAQFAGSGGPVGFVGRSALLGGLEAYNKNQNIGQGVAGAIEGGAVGAATEAIAPGLKGVAKLMEEKGPGFAKDVIKQFTNLGEEDAKTAVDTIDEHNLNPFTTRGEYAQEKTSIKEQLDTVKGQNKEILASREKELNSQAELAKSQRDAALEAQKLDASKTLQDLVDNKTSQQIASVEAISQRVAESAEVSANAKMATLNDMESTLGGMVQKIGLNEQAMEENINVATTMLDSQGMATVPQAVLEARIAPIKQMPAFKDLFKPSKVDETALRGVLKTHEAIALKNVAKAFQYDDIATMLKEAPEEVLNQVRMKLPEIFNRPEVAQVFNNIKETGAGYKETAILLKKVFGDVEAAKEQGHINVRNLDELVDRLKGAYTTASPARKQILGKLRSQITPSNIYRDAQMAVDKGELPTNPVAHLKDLAEARREYSQKIDNLRLALGTIQDEKGNIKVDNIFNVFANGNKRQQAMLLKADAALPEEDRVFSKLKDQYDAYKQVKDTEIKSTKALRDNIAINREKLRKMYSDTSTQLGQQTRLMTAGNMNAGKAMSSASKAELEGLRQKKDAEFQVLDEQLSKRLKFLKIEEALTKTQTSANPLIGYVQRHAVWSSVLPAVTTGNPMAAVPGLVMAGAISPAGISNMIRTAKHSIPIVKGASEVAKNKALKAIVNSKILAGMTQ